jgi:hypothetical protein
LISVDHFQSREKNEEGATMTMFYAVAGSALAGFIFGWITNYVLWAWSEGYGRK